MLWKVREVIWKKSLSPQNWPISKSNGVVKKSRSAGYSRSKSQHNFFVFLYISIMLSEWALHRKMKQQRKARIHVQGGGTRAVTFLWTLTRCRTYTIAHAQHFILSYLVLEEKPPCLDDCPVLCLNSFPRLVVGMFYFFYLVHTRLVFSDIFIKVSFNHKDGGRHFSFGSKIFCYKMIHILRELYS